jgi:hypothetical protein
MEATRSSKMSVIICQNIRCHVLEDSNFYRAKFYQRSNSTPFFPQADDLPPEQIEGKNCLRMFINVIDENVAQYRRLGTTVTSQNMIQGEIKRRLNSDNACYHSVQHFLSSGLLSKNIKIKIYKTIILPVVLYGCETWFLTLSEKRRLRVSENRVLRRIFGPKRDEVTGGWRKLHNEELHNLYSSPDIIRIIKSRRIK